MTHQRTGASGRVQQSTAMMLLTGPWRRAVAALRRQPGLLAAQIGVDVGSTITFGTTTISRPFVVHGIYRDLTTSPFDHYWCAVSRQFVAANLSTEDIPPLRGLIDPSLIVEYAQAAGVGVRWWPV
jgi:hypothetical protein